MPKESIIFNGFSKSLGEPKNDAFDLCVPKRQTLQLRTKQSTKNRLSRLFANEKMAPAARRLLCRRGLPLYFGMLLIYAAFASQLKRAG